MRSIELLMKDGQDAADDNRHWTERRAEALGCKHLGLLWEREEDGECALWRCSSDDFEGACLSMLSFEEDIFIGRDEALPLEVAFWRLRSAPMSSSGPVKS